jgi:hypothetical protein
MFPVHCMVGGLTEPTPAAAAAESRASLQ